MVSDILAHGFTDDLLPCAYDVTADAVSAPVRMVAAKLLHRREQPSHPHGQDGCQRSEDMSDGHKQGDKSSPSRPEIRYGASQPRETLDRLVLESPNHAENIHYYFFGSLV